MNYFTIKGKLPGLNEYTRACRGKNGDRLGAKFKRDVEEQIGWAIKLARTSKTLHAVNGPVIVRIEWYESTKRRDVDNIVFAKKFILDALVSNGILQDDGRKYVKQIYDTVIDFKTDLVAVSLEEIKEEMNK